MNGRPVGDHIPWMATGISSAMCSRKIAELFRIFRAQNSAPRGSKTVHSQGALNRHCRMWWTSEMGIRRWKVADDVEARAVGMFLMLPYAGATRYL